MRVARNMYRANGAPGPGNLQRQCNIHEIRPGVEFARRIEVFRSRADNAPRIHVARFMDY
jgi:hypothetical protein